MTRRVLALACALLTAAVSVARASDRAEASTVAANAGQQARSGAARAGRSPHRRAARGRASSSGRVDGRPASPLIAAVNGIPGRYFAWLGGQVADRARRGARPRSRGGRKSRGISLDRPVRGTHGPHGGGDRRALGHTSTSASTGAGVGVAIIDSGVSPLARRPRRTGSSTSPTSSTPSRSPTTTTATARTSPASSRATAVRLGTARRARRRARRAPRRAEGARRHRQRLHQQRHRRHRLRDREPRRRYNIRVINLSVAAGVYESFTTDPLTLAAKRAVDAGIVVVAAAGNLGRDGDGTAAVRRHRLARQRAVGAHRRRLEPPRHGRSRATTRSRRSARADRRRSTTTPSPISSRRAWASSRSADPSSALFAAQSAARGSGARSQTGERAVPQPDAARAWRRRSSPAPSR